jgi:UDP-N-acetylmuramate--alanine ligase
VTNIDEDHLAAYGGEFSQLRENFVEFLHHLPFYGLAVLCIDDPWIRALLAEVGRPILTYGLSEDAALRAIDIRHRGTRTAFSVELPEDGGRIDVSLNLPGRHNVLNALAAIAIGWELGVAAQAIVSALGKFQGIDRRFQVHGEIRSPRGPVLLVDDYGHHPTEIAATVRAAREVWPERRLVLAFQPHRYTRTRDLFEDFARVLSEVDRLLLCDVYGAGEAPISDADGRALARAIRARGRVDPVFVNAASELPAALCSVLEEGDVLLLLGAGDIGAVPAMLTQSLGVVS